jgi:Tol biopolymer transport system component
MNKYQLFLLSSIVFITFNCSFLKEPELFEPNIISTRDGFELNICFTATGDTLFFTKVRDYYRSPFMIFTSSLIGGKWSTPLKMYFNGKYSNYNPFITPDGKTLYFTSNRPSKIGELKNDSDIWFIDKKGDNWSKPERLTEKINTTLNQFGTSISKNGDMYFSTMIKDTYGLHDIYYSRLDNGEYSTPVNLGGNINSSNNDYDPAVSYDEKILVFSRDGDLYVSYNKNNIWSLAKKLNSKINTSATEFKPYITFDKKYLYFTSTVKGSGDIYRILLKDAGIKTD